MQVGSRNDGFASAQSIRKRSGNHLLFVLVRRDVNVRRADQFNHLPWTHETIAENYIGLYAEIAGQLLQIVPVLVSFTPQNVRMSYAGNHVDNIVMAREDFRKSLDDIFNALIRRKQPKRKQDIFSFRSEPILIKTGI